FDAPLVTREAETDGETALPVVAIDRLGGDRAFRGLALGLGLSGGAVALTTGWESPSMLVAGDQPADMVVALERLKELHGGAVVASGGAVLAEWRAELGGLYSLAPLGQVVSEVATVNGALRDLGCPMPNPLLSLETLTTAAIPFLRLSADGYVRLTDGARLGLEV
ncbi:MAG TPA: adenine deaminase C-terminal domain-containing protein, partial [Candidatus Dormibacteraeota bacterium]